MAAELLSVVSVPTPGGAPDLYPMGWGRPMAWAWMAGFRHTVAFSPDERSVLTTVARMLAQALTRAGAAGYVKKVRKALFL